MPILVADDAIGGFFALDGGKLGDPGKVFYLEPDSLRRINLELSYSEFLNSMFQSDLDEFYKGLRWKGWRSEVKQLGGEQGLSFYPFLFTQGPALEKRSRKAVPILELYKLEQDFIEKFHPQKLPPKTRTPLKSDLTS